MKKYLLLLLIISLVVFVAILFQSSPNPVGVYVAKHNVNTIDSLFVNEGGVYYRAIYGKKNGEVMFKNSGQWQYKNERIVFSDFFPNDDSELKEGYNYNSVLMTYSVPLEKSFGRVVFDYDETTAKFRFYKLYW